MWSRVFVTEAANKIKEMSGYYSEGEIINIYHQYINIYIPQNSAIQNNIFFKTLYSGATRSEPRRETVSEMFTSHTGIPLTKLWPAFI